MIPHCRIRWHRLLFTGLVFIMAITLSSCTSGRRWWRSSPLSRKASVKADPDRVPLWPIYYQNYDSKSILLLIDHDDQGFAIHPLFSVDGDDYSLLWPVSSWNTSRKDGRFLNAYWDKDSFGIFPISHVEEDWGFALNTYWDDDSFGVFPVTHIGDDWGYFLTAYWGKDVSGLFPLYHVGPKNGAVTLAYWNTSGWGVFPLNYTRYDGSGGYAGPVFWDDETFGIFPVMYANDDWGYALNTYWYDDTFGIYPLMHAGPDGGFALNTYWDDDAFGVFPLMHAGPDWGFALNTYWDDDAFGVFPLMHAGDGWGFALNAYWGKDLYGMFPLFSVNTTLSYVGPAWWTDDSGGVFPLYHYNDKGDHLRHRLLGALGSWEQDKDHHQSWLFPLWYLDKEKDEHTFVSPLGGSYENGGHSGHWLFPLWWHDVEGQTTQDITPFMYSNRSPKGNVLISPLVSSVTTDDSSWLWAFPTWYSESTPRGSMKSLFPLWHKSERGDEETSWLFPFYFENETKDHYSLYSPLGNYTKGGGKTNLNIYPLWWSSVDNLATYKTFLPFYHYRNKSGLKSLITPLGGYGWDDQGTATFRNILGPLYHHHQTTDNSFELTGVAWPLYTKWRQDDTTHEIIPLLYDRTSTPTEETINMLGYLCQIHLDKTSASWMMFPFISASDRASVPNALWHFNLFHFYDYGDKKITRLTPLYQHTKNGDTSSSYLFPLYHRSDTPAETDIDMLGFLGDYNRTAAGSSWRMWPLVANSEQAKTPDLLYNMSLFSRHAYGDASRWWCTPLVGGTRRGDASSQWTFPLYSYTNSPAETDLDILGVLGDYNRTPAGSSWRLWPLVANSEQPKTPDLLYNLSLFSRHAYGDSSRWWCTPLVGGTRRGDASSQWTFPLYSYTNSPAETDLDMLGFLGDYNRTPAGSSWRLWPLVANSEQSKTPDALYNLSLFSRHAFGDASRWWCTPLVGGGRDGDASYHWVLPFYTYTNSPAETDIDMLGVLGDYNRTPAGTSWRLWPLVANSEQPHTPDALYNLSLFSRHAFGDSSRWWCTPLVGGTRRGDASSQWTFPLYMYSKDNDEVDVDMLMWLADYNKTSQGSSYRLWPLASVNHQSERPDLLYYLSLSSFSSYAGNTSWWFTPLIGGVSTTSGSLNWVLPFGWWSHDDAGDLDVRYLLGLGNIQTHKGDITRSSLFPLYSYAGNDPGGAHYLHFINWSKNNAGSTDFGLFPFYNHSTYRDEDRLIKRNYSLFGLVFFDETIIEPETTRNNYLYMLLAHGAAKRYPRQQVPQTFESGLMDDSYDLLFPFYWKDRTVTRAWKPEAVTEDEIDVLGQWWIDHHQKNQSKVPNSAVIDILTRHGMEVKDESTKSLKKEVLAFTEKHSNDHVKSSVISPVYWSSSDGKSTNWTALLKLAYYRSNWSKRSSTLRILGLVFWREREDDVIRRTFFPFCKWDTEGKASNFSFLWRLWHRKKDKNGTTSGHFLFIPWGGE